MELLRRMLLRRGKGWCLWHGLLYHILVCTAWFSNLVIQNFKILFIFASQFGFLTEAEGRLQNLAMQQQQYKACNKHWRSREKMGCTNFLSEEWVFFD